MQEHRITQSELICEMERLAEAGLPFPAARGLSLSTVLSRHGVRHRHRGILALEPPELLPPYEAYRDLVTMDIVIRQGDAA